MCTAYKKVKFRIQMMHIAQWIVFLICAAVQVVLTTFFVSQFTNTIFARVMKLFVFTY